MRNGNKGPYGCKRGRDCAYFHPHMCRESLNSKTCSRSYCKYYHVRGTVQCEPQQASDEEHQQSQYQRNDRNQRNEEHQPTQYRRNQRREEPQQTQYQRNQQNQYQRGDVFERQPKESESFLEAIKQLQQQMMSIQDQLATQQKESRELRREIRPSVPPQEEVIQQNQKQYPTTYSYQTPVVQGIQQIPVSQVQQFQNQSYRIVRDGPP